MGKISDLDLGIKETQRMHEDIVKMIASKTKYTVKTLKTSMQKNIYLTPKQAIEHGVADRVINSFSQMGLKNW